jgi:hypothetical protein
MNLTQTSLTESTELIGCTRRGFSAGPGLMFAKKLMHPSPPPVASTRTSRALWRPVCLPTFLIRPDLDTSIHFSPL